MPPLTLPEDAEAIELFPGGWIREGPVAGNAELHRYCAKVAVAQELRYGVSALLGYMGRAQEGGVNLPPGTGGRWAPWQRSPVSGRAGS